jgi:hypothetical protein
MTPGRATLNGPRALHLLRLKLLSEGIASAAYCQISSCSEALPFWRGSQIVRKRHDLRGKIGEP